MLAFSGIVLPGEDDAAALFPGCDLDGFAAEQFGKGADD